MRFPFRLLRLRSRRDVPAAIYISLVDALFDDARSLLIGSVAASTATLVGAWKTGNVPLLLCALAIAIVAGARTLDMRAFARVRLPASTEAASRWELRYVVGAAAYVALLGLACLVAFATTNDPFVRLFGFSTVLAYLIGISGRNFASKLLVDAQIICAGIPMTAALLSAEDPYYFFFALIIVPFFVSLRFISARLRRTLLNAVIATQDVTRLASRFDAALNNMAHGLCMVDAHSRVLVSNRRFKELLGLSADGERSLSVRDVVAQCVRAGRMQDSAADRFTAEFESRLAARAGGRLLVHIEDGRTLDLTFQPMEKGGSVVLVEDITERRKAEAKIHHLARYDALTGLPNRTFFHDQIDAALARTERQSDAHAVLCIDLDQFKEVNDTLGHPVGDRLLCAVADRLRGAVRDIDVVARLGGDEFVILQSRVTSPDDVAALAKRTIELLGEPYEIEGHQLVIGASIGAALATREGQSADDLLKNADMALYQAKADGRGTWRLFEPEMDRKAQARRSLEMDLRQAVAGGGFQLHYQPLFNLRTNRISTCEALLRWPHPERGMVSPAEFIPVAEEMGLIVEIGNWVLGEACREALHWPSDIRVAVNLSPIQFWRGDVVAAVRRALAASKLPASRLEVEITESVLLQDLQATRVAIHQLRELGIRIALDDFGTGYSSLSYLHSFPFDKVKIDRSFLCGLGTDERTAKLLCGVARLSADLGMSVTVEGVETAEQLALIAAERSIEEAQGYYFSKPRLAGELRDFIRDAAWKPQKVA